MIWAIQVQYDTTFSPPISPPYFFWKGRGPLPDLMLMQDTKILWYLASALNQVTLSYYYQS